MGSEEGQCLALGHRWLDRRDGFIVDLDRGSLAPKASGSLREQPSKPAARFETRCCASLQSALQASPICHVSSEEGQKRVHRTIGRKLPTKEKSAPASTCHASVATSLAVAFFARFPPHQEIASAANDSRRLLNFISKHHHPCACYSRTVTRRHSRNKIWSSTSGTYV